MDYVSDKEQIEMIKDWWRENGRFTILSIAVAIILTAGWRYWQNSKIKESAAASIAYEQLLSHEATHQYGIAESEVTGMLANHPRTPYASLAAFISAQNAIKSNHFEAALEKFDWVIAHSKSSDFKQIAKIRKARLLLAMNKYQEGLDLLATVDSEAYLPLVNEVKGDLLLAKGDKKAALAAYQYALNSLPSDAPNRNFLQMKFDQING